MSSTQGSWSMFQLKPSLEKAEWMRISLRLSSTRNTPANSPLKGTTAELKMELEQGMAFLWTMGLFEYLHSTSLQP